MRMEEQPIRDKRAYRPGSQLGEQDRRRMRAFPVGFLVHTCRGPVEHNRLNPLFGVLPLFAEEKHGNSYQFGYQFSAKKGKMRACAL